MYKKTNTNKKRIPNIKYKSLDCDIGHYIHRVNRDKKEYKHLSSFPKLEGVLGKRKDYYCKYNNDATLKYIREITKSTKDSSNKEEIKKVLEEDS